jgi:L-fuculose-phosphate aldolase
MIEMMSGQPVTADVRWTLAAARRILYRHGCDSAVAGHVSARADDGQGFWMTPFEYFDETTPERVVQLDWELRPVGTTLPASPAASFHSAIYRRRSDIGSIVHIHSHWVSVLASTDRFVGQYNVAAALYLDEQRNYVDDGARPSVDGERMADELGDGTILWMRNHGALIVGDTIERTTILAMVLEQQARYTIECAAAGGDEMAEVEARRVKGQYHKYYLGQMWEANVRRLRASDPDLFEGADAGLGPADGPSR